MQTCKISNKLNNNEYSPPKEREKRVRNIEAMKKRTDELGI